MKSLQRSVQAAWGRCTGQEYAHVPGGDELFGRQRCLSTIFRGAVFALFLAVPWFCALPVGAQSAPADQTQGGSTQQQAAAPAQDQQTEDMQANNAEH